MGKDKLPRLQRWALASFVRRFPVFHLVIGLVGNATFIAGAVLYLTKHPDPGLYCFLVGSSGMFLGTLGETLRILGERRLARFDVDPAYPDKRWSQMQSPASKI